MPDIFQQILSDYTLRTVAMGAGLLGIVSGALGSFAVLRRQALLGDAVSHATLPGIALAFLLTSSKAPIVLLVGAMIAGWIGTLFVMAVVRHTRIKEDAALGLILSVFFGIGLVLLTFIQKQPIASQAGLDKFLFGQAATLMTQDVITMAALGIPVLFLVLIFWKELKILSFDPDYGNSIGFPVRFLDVLLTSMIVVAIVIGLQTVGVVLMSAMIVAPAVAARQWTDRLSVMVLLSALFGGISGVVGALLSSMTSKMPTGPTIVVVVSVIVAVSLLFAPNRGLVGGWVRDLRNRERIRMETLLGNLYLLALQHEDPFYPHSSEAVRAMSGVRASIRKNLGQLEMRGWAEQSGERWALTEDGVSQARRIFGQENVS